MTHNVKPEHACIADINEWTGPGDNRLREALHDPSVDVRTFMSLIVDYGRALVQLKMRATGIAVQSTTCRSTKEARIYDALTELH